MTTTLLGKRKRRALPRMLKDSFPGMRDEFVRVVMDDDDAVIKFDDLLTYAKTPCEWVCSQTNCPSKCAHRFVATVQQRTAYNKQKFLGCPYCSGRKVCLCQSLATLFPAVAQQLHESNAHKATELAPHAETIVTWKCQSATCTHHVWRTKVRNRTDPLKPTSCPFCCGFKVCPCYNLATQYPKVAASFDYVQNAPLQPQDITPASHKRLWWICTAHNDLHEPFRWRAKVYQRTLRENGCPKCKQSKMEAAMEKVLQTMQNQNEIVEFVRDKAFLGSRLRPDFLVTFQATPAQTHQIVVEMDGEQHFSTRFYQSRRRHTDPEASLHKIQARDQRKKELCEKHQIPLLRISYRIARHRYLELVRAFLAKCKASPQTFHFEVQHTQS